MRSYKARLSDVYRSCEIELHDLFIRNRTETIVPQTRTLTWVNRALI
jgi:hypothetical protein